MIIVFAVVIIAGLIIYVMDAFSKTVIKKKSKLDGKYCYPKTQKDNALMGMKSNDRFAWFYDNGEIYVDKVEIVKKGREEISCTEFNRIETEELYTFMK